MSERSTIDILYILGAGHCGSTLLSLMLDRHPDVVAVSEIIGLNTASPGMAGGDAYSGIEFWDKVAADYEARNGKSFWNVRFKPPAGREGTASRQRWLTENRLAFESIAQVSEKRIVADASKQAGRLRMLLNMEGIRIRVVYLVRDARAVVHAYDRKYGRVTHGVRKVAKLDRRARKLRSLVPAKNWLVLRYEDLALNVEPTLHQLCTFLDIEFEPSMLSPDTSSFIGIGGNRLRRKPVRIISLDDAWRVSGLILRRYNRLYGYGR